MKLHEVYIEYLDKPKNQRVSAEIRFSNGVIVIRKMFLTKYAFQWANIDGFQHCFDLGTGTKLCMTIADGASFPSPKNLLESSLRLMA